jgi:hypothetical protein
MCMFVVTQGIEDRGGRSDGGHGSEQDGSGAERLAAGDIEAGSGESGTPVGRGCCMGVLGCSGGEPGRRRSGWVGRRHWYCKRAAKGWRELMVGSAAEGRHVLLSQE